MCKTLSSLSQRLKAEALDQPVLVIESAKVLKSLNQFLDRAEVTHSKQLLLQGLEKVFDAAIALRSRPNAGEEARPRNRLSL